MWARTQHLSTWKAQVGRSGVQGYPQPVRGQHGPRTLFFFFHTGTSTTEEDTEARLPGCNFSLCSQKDPTEVTETHYASAHPYPYETEKPLILSTHGAAS